MKLGLKIRLLTVAAVTLWAAHAALSQFVPKSTASQWPKWVQNLLYTGNLNLGLDLRGGAHFVLGPDMDRVLIEALKREGQAVIATLNEAKIPIESNSYIKEGKEDIFRLEFESEAVKKKADKNLEENFPMLVVHFEEETSLDLKILDVELNDLRTKTIDQSIQVLQGRINEFGVKEPQIYKAGSNRIIVQFPGLEETQQVKRIIGRTAKLEFRAVSTKLNPKAVAELFKDVPKFSEKSNQSIPEYTRTINEQYKDKLPENTAIRFEKRVNERTQEVTYAPILVKDVVELTGQHVQNARVAVNPDTQLPEVILTFNPLGTRLFGEFTKAHVQKPSAIILDDLVYSTPVIRQAIYGGRASITLGSLGGYTELHKEASDLVVVLRAGALPTTLAFLEERTIGPSLGSDSIRAGALSAIIGGLLVLLFMVLYYRSVGLIAASALALNALLLLAIMTAMGATLTLPGIAGIVLTFGMSVDANIIIFERIRENLYKGRGVGSSVMSGYERALITILDANITTIFAGIILMQYGTGAIKGFAVTLILGILTSLFTAYFAAKACSEWIYNRQEANSIRIGITYKQKRKA